MNKMETKHLSQKLTQRDHRLKYKMQKHKPLEDTG